MIKGTPFGSSISFQHVCICLPACSTNNQQICDRIWGLNVSDEKMVLQDTQQKSNDHCSLNYAWFLKFKKIIKLEIFHYQYSIRWWMLASLFMVLRLLKCLHIPPTIPGTTGNSSKNIHLEIHLCSVSIVRISLSGGRNRKTFWWIWQLNIGNSISKWLKFDVRIIEFSVAS